MRIVSSTLDMIEACRMARRPLGLVPTMGSLHNGHMTLVKRAMCENATVVASIFVNPTQFSLVDRSEDYPRSLTSDLDLLEKDGVDFVFTPSVAEMFPDDMDTWVQPHAIGMCLEGEYRPGHYRGVATVVTKLFNIVMPDYSYFGQKDWQQVVVIKRMVVDLNSRVIIRVVPTKRESNGLAMSSRNSLLDREQWIAAPILFHALQAAKDLFIKGEQNSAVLIREVMGVLANEVLVRSVDYVYVVDTATLNKLDVAAELSMIVAAVWIGEVRLIDNIVLS